MGGKQFCQMWLHFVSLRRACAFALVPRSFAGTPGGVATCSGVAIQKTKFANQKNKIANQKNVFFFPEFRHQNWVCAYRRRSENDIKVEKKLHLNCTAIPPGPDLIPGRCYIGFGPVSHWLRDIGFGPVSQMPEAGCTNARGRLRLCLRPVAFVPEAGCTNRKSNESTFLNKMQKVIIFDRQ